jgi:polyisoprenoid-binding protein YceI
MFKRLLIVGGIVIVLALAVVGYTVFRTPEAASGPITAIPIAATSAPAATSDAPAQSAMSATAAEGADTAAESAASAGLIFEILPGESEARFVIDEVLRGAPTTVVGATDQVAGQIAIDPSDPQSAQVGTIQVNARTLATDNDFRNRAIKNAILRTDSFEYITFAPTAISGMPESVAVGEPIAFQMTGDLTIAGATQPVTFDVTVTPLSDTELSGTASATVRYRDFGLAIPDSPQVDTVADEVRLELQFVAETAA